MLAFFRVELHSKNIIARDTTGKAFRINAVSGDQVLFHRIDIVAVHIVETCPIFDVIPHGMKLTAIRLLPVNLVPPHVRNLELVAFLVMHIVRESPHLALENAQAGSIAFFAVLEQQLHAYADAEKRLFGSGGDDGVTQTTALQLTHAVWHGTLARKHNTLGCMELGGIAGDNDLAVRSHVLQRLGHRAKIAHTVIYYCNINHMNLEQGMTIKSPWLKA